MPRRGRRWLNCTSTGQSSVGPSAPSAQVVGNAFVQQYYQILCGSPELAYRFYKESSKLGRVDANGVMDSVTTLEAIKKKILATRFNEFDIKKVDVQESLRGGLIVSVTGDLTRSDIINGFAQSFFLAPQDQGYFVLNDLLRLLARSSLDTSEQSISARPQPPAQMQNNPVPHSLSPSPTLTTQHPPAPVDVQLAESIRHNLSSGSSATPATPQHRSAPEEAAELAEAIDALFLESQSDSGVSEQSTISNIGVKSCLICFDAPAEGACVPCGHMSGCMPCLNVIKRRSGCCPVCRAKIDQVLKIYAV